MNARPAPTALETSDASAASVRAFLAVCLSPAVQERLVRLKRDLTASGAGVRWTRDEGLHLTLKFLGSVTVDRLASLRDTLAASLRDIASFSARAAGLGVFPRPQRPRIIWVGVQAPDLPRLAELIERAASRLGFAAEERPFRGHVTLGRIKDPRRWKPVAAALQEHCNEDFGTFAVRHVTAFRSDLQRGGSVYTEIWTIPLQSGIGGGDYGIGRESRASAGPGRQPD
jgi:2'-5' RNA ligase